MRKGLLVLVWWFIIFGSGETQVGPFTTLANCAGIRQEALRIYLPNYVSSCFEDTRR